MYDLIYPGLSNITKCKCINRLTVLITTMMGNNYSLLKIILISIWLTTLLFNSKDHNGNK